MGADVAHPASHGPPAPASRCRRPPTARQTAGSTTFRAGQGVVSLGAAPRGTGRRAMDASVTREPDAEVEPVTADHVSFDAFVAARSGTLLRSAYLLTGE